MKRIGCILLMLLPIGGVTPARAATAPPELVTQIQNDLAALGYDPGPADGSLDSKTQLAIARFEAANGLPFTGQPTFELAFAIRKAIASGGPKATPQSSPAPVVTAPAKSPQAPAPAITGAATDFQRMAAECESRVKTDPRFMACAMACRSAAEHPVDLNNKGTAPHVVNMGAASAAIQCPRQYQSAMAAVQKVAAAAAAEEAKLASVDRSAVGAPAPGDYVYAYDYGPHLRIEPPNPRMRAIKVSTHAGKPRLGTPDSLGVEDQRRKNTLSGDQTVAYKQRLEEMRLHRTAYALMVAIQLLEPRYRNVDRSKMYIGAMTNSSTQEQANEYQARLLLHALAFITASPAVFGDYFCNARVKRCHPPTAGTAIQVGWGGLMADEFAQRDAFQAFMGTAFDDLVQWTKKAPRDAVLVSTASVGEFDFENGKFTGSLDSGPKNRDLLGFGMSPLAVMRRADGKGHRHGAFDLPMSIDQARSLRDRLQATYGAPLYAVTEIRFASASLDPLRSAALDYEIVSPRVTLYFDEGLTEKLAEVTVTWH